MPSACLKYNFLSLSRKMFFTTGMFGKRPWGHLPMLDPHFVFSNAHITSFFLEKLFLKQGYV